MMDLFAEDFLKITEMVIDIFTERYTAYKSPPTFIGWDVIYQL